MKYNTILIDPPWPITLTGKYTSTRCHRPDKLPYPTLSLAAIYRLPIESLANIGCHLYLWTTNKFLHTGFHALRHWNFTYLIPLHWIKPSGLGNYFVHRTQTMLFAYYKKCIFRRARYRPNILEAPATKHSQKPTVSYDLIEAVSPPPRLELFARQQRPGWDVWGNEVESTIELHLEVN